MVLNRPGWPGRGHLDHNTANAPHIALAAVPSGPNHLTEGGGREGGRGREREGEEGGEEGSREGDIHKEGEGGIKRDIKVLRHGPPT